MEFKNALEFIQLNKIINCEKLNNRHIHKKQLCIRIKDSIKIYCYGEI